MKKLVLLIASCFIFLLSLTAQNGTEPIRITDMLKIKTASGVSLNKQGTKAIFSLTRIEPDEQSKLDYKYVTQLWLADLDNNNNVLRPLSGKESASQASWSPDGKEIVFVRSAQGKPQLFLLSLAGGEAQQLTFFKYGASSPKWSPDGQQILFSASISIEELLKDSLVNSNKAIPAWDFEKPGISNATLFAPSTAKPDADGTIEQVRAYLKNNEQDKKAKVLNKLNFQNELDVSTQMSFSHLFIIHKTAPKKPVQLTHGFFSAGSADFTPDGKSIVFSGSRDSLQHPDRVQESGIYSLRTDGTNFSTILYEKGKRLGSPSLSPSGKWLVFSQSNTSFVSIPEFMIMDWSAPGKPEPIPFDRNKSGISWQGDDRFYFTAQSNGAVILHSVDIKTKKVTALTDKQSGISSFAIAGNKLMYTKTEVANPSELYIADAQANNSKRISDFNTGWLKTKKLSFPEKKTWVNEKGLTVEYWTMKPTNYGAGKKYPLLLEIHGGPSAMWGPGEASMWHEYQYFCSKGYGVVYSNPRGSGGYGEAFLQANVNDWGKGPTSDVLTALDKTVAEGWADTSNLFVTGGSYAGFLVAWIIGHDHRFKAACAQRGVYDLSTFLGEGNAWRLVPNYFGGYPWDSTAKQTLERESPINYVHNIKTPLIIFHGENDRRTGVIQSEMLYRSLKILNQPVEYVRHPGASHEITRTGDNRQRIDQLLRTWEFFERWKNK